MPHWTCASFCAQLRKSNAQVKVRLPVSTRW
jgi:hypothetical protein